jgi:hypothetical protein
MTVAQRKDFRVVLASTSYIIPYFILGSVPRGFPKTEFLKSEFWLSLVVFVPANKTSRTLCGLACTLWKTVILCTKPVKSQTTAMATIATRRTHH